MKRVAVHLFGFRLLNGLLHSLSCHLWSWSRFRVQSLKRADGRRGKGHQGRWTVGPVSITTVDIVSIGYLVLQLLLVLLFPLVLLLLLLLLVLLFELFLLYCYCYYYYFYWNCYYYWYYCYYYYRCYYHHYNHDYNYNHTYKLQPQLHSNNCNQEMGHADSFLSLARLYGLMFFAGKCQRYFLFDLYGWIWSPEIIIKETPMQHMNL